MRPAIPCYKPFPVEGGWTIFWIFPDGEKKPAEDGNVYPQRQNAYRRSKQLNEENNPPYPVYVRMLVERKNCNALRWKLEEMIPLHGIYILDPLFEADEHEDRYNKNTRYIQFGRVVKWKSDDRDPDLGSVDDDTNPLECDFMKWLMEVKRSFHVDMECSYHSYDA